MPSVSVCSDLRTQLMAAFKNRAALSETEASEIRRDLDRIARAASVETDEILRAIQEEVAMSSRSTEPRTACAVRPQEK